MKIASLIITYLVGLVFFVFGANHFFNFIPNPPMTGDAGTWAGIMMTSGYMTVVKILEIVGGGMLLANFKRPLAWLILLPIIVNITLFEVCLAKAPGIGIALLALNAFMLYVNKDSYKGII
jgi:putative oxidoreductase